MEINDVSKEEALQYLKSRKIDEEQAAQIYELTGGRMIHLKHFADDIGQNKGTFEGICTACYAEKQFLTAFIDVRKKLFSDAASQLNSAQVLSGLSYHEEGAKIIRELLKKGSISEDAYYSLVGHVIGGKLLETNVFALHFDSEEITFQSTVMKRYCEKKFGLLGIRLED
jgi:hypothetical protein